MKNIIESASSAVSAELGYEDFQRVYENKTSELRFIEVDGKKVLHQLIGIHTEAHRYEWRPVEMLPSA